MAGRVGHGGLVGVAVVVLLGTTACTSGHPKTEVQGEVLTKDDQYLGGPSPALAQFRAGERAVYGSGVSVP